MNSTDPTTDHVDKNATDYVDESVEMSESVSATNDSPKVKPRNINHRQLKKVPKIGRNTPCPCGSGIKYKKCHLIEQEKQIQQQMNVMKQVEELIKAGTE